MKNYLCSRAYGYYHDPVLTIYLIVPMKTFNKISMELNNNTFIGDYLQKFLLKILHMSIK